MKIVLPNIWMLSFRIALLAFFIYMYQWPWEKIETGQYRENEPVFWFVLLLFVMLPAYFVWTLLGVLWATISNDKTTICFYYFYKKVKVAGADMDGYFKTTNKTKISTFRSLLIKIKSGKVLEVTEYNLQSINSITDFLEHNKVPFWGDKNSWFPFKPRI